MRRKNLIRMAAWALILTGGFAVLRSTAFAHKNHSCKDSMDQCCKKKSQENDKTTWESLSHGFFSSI